VTAGFAVYSFVGHLARKKIIAFPSCSEPMGPDFRWDDEGGMGTTRKKRAAAISTVENRIRIA